MRRETEGDAAISTFCSSRWHTLAPILPDSRFFSSQEQISPSFSTLPQDVILEILKVSDWRSLICLRKTCKDLREMSRTLPIWRSQYRQFITSHKLTFRLEEPLESYSSTELEQWVMFRRSVDLAWQYHNARPTRTRTVKSKSISKAVGDILIIPGGRWLLVGDGKGSIMYYDLDAPDMPEQFLIKPQDPHFQQNVRHLRVCIDEREPKLTFTLAFSAASPRTETCKFDSPKTQIWKVTLVGHGANANLSAQPIVHIQSDDQGLITFLAIRGHTLARAVFRIGCVHIEIYDWTRVTESKCQRALIFLDNDPRYISILPDNRLLVLVPERLLIYAIPMLEEATAGDWIPVEAHTKPLFDLPFYSRGIGAFGVSRPLISNRAICFVVCSQESVYSLEIFHETGCPQFSLLALFQNEDETIFGGGFEKIFVQRSRSVATISLDWNLEPSAKIVSVNHTFPTKRKMYAPIFDEESGRILQFTDSTVAIVDTANCFV